MATGRAKPQELTDTPEMPTLASSDPESSNTVESPSGIDVMSSASPSSVSPGSVFPEASTDHQDISCVDIVTSSVSPGSVLPEASTHPEDISGCSCCDCFIGCGGICNWVWNMSCYGGCFNIFPCCLRTHPCLIFLYFLTPAAIGFFIWVCVYFVQNKGLAEVVCAALLVLYCAFISRFDRGCFSKLCSCTCCKRNEGDGNPSVMTHGQESTRDAVSSESRMDVPEQPQAVQID